MNLLVISDSHGRLSNVEEAIRRTRPDAILFAGDGLRDISRADPPCPVFAVRGNCDTMVSTVILGGVEVTPDDERCIDLDGVRILLCHGHRYGVKSTLSVAISHAAARGADLLVFGHTHTPTELTLLPGHGDMAASLEKPLIVLNPGSIGDGLTPSFGTITIRGGRPLCGHGRL